MDLAGRLRRVRSRAVGVLQCAVGASVAYALAEQLLGHERPLFAAIAAVVALGVSFRQRLRRVVEVVTGVAVGVLVGDLIVGVAGSGAWQIAMVVAIAMTVAVFLGASPLLINQAAVQAVFVAALLPTPGEGLNRWLDAAMGGAVALVIATVVPTSALRRPLALAADVLRDLAALLAEGATAARSGDVVGSRDALLHARGTQQGLDTLSAAAAEGLDVVASSPWRRNHGSNVRGVVALSVPLDRAVRNVRVLTRRLASAVERDDEVPPALLESLDGLAAAAGRLADRLAGNFGLDDAVAELVTVARQTASVPRSSLSSDVVLAQVRSIVVDLLAVAGLDEAEALSLVREVTN